MMQEYLIQILAGFVGTVGFAVLFNMRGKRLVFAALGGLLSWGLFILFHHFVYSEAVCYFVVAWLMSAYAEIMARVLKSPTTAFITTALIPLIPGGSLYYTMSNAFLGDMNVFVQKALSTLQLAAALALGVIVSSTLTRLVQRGIQKYRQKGNSA